MDCYFCAIQEALMIPRDIFNAVIGATLLAWSGVSIAEEYRPDELLGLDLSSAVLSPKPLGPAAGFAPGPLDVSVDRGRDGAQARAEPVAEPKIVVHNARVAHQRAEQPHGTARTKLAGHHHSPLDAQAFDARVQVWPCRSGGICNWKR
jgi:hypothetical protein